MDCGARRSAETHTETTRAVRFGPTSDAVLREASGFCFEGSESCSVNVRTHVERLSYSSLSVLFHRFSHALSLIRATHCLHTAYILPTCPDKLLKMVYIWIVMYLAIDSHENR